MTENTTRTRSTSRAAGGRGVALAAALLLGHTGAATAEERPGFSITALDPGLDAGYGHSIAIGTDWPKPTKPSVSVTFTSTAGRPSPCGPVKNLK